jgi:hypothetical protein
MVNKFRKGVLTWRNKDEEESYLIIMFMPALDDR